MTSGSFRSAVATLFLAGVGGLALGVGCGHTTTVGDNEAPAGSGGEQEKAADGQGDSGEKSHNKDTSTKDGAAAGQQREGSRRRQGSGTGASAADKDDAKSTKGEDERAALPIATSPAGLLKPEALEKVQGQLISRGELKQDTPSGKFDGATREALRSFQRNSGLPATGAPDDATVRELGLDPADVFKASGQNTK